jgi:hypothetical protein
MDFSLILNCINIVFFLFFFRSGRSALAVYTIPTADLSGEVVKSKRNNLALVLRHVSDTDIAAVAVAPAEAAGMAYHVVTCGRGSVKSVAGAPKLLFCLCLLCFALLCHLKQVLPFSSSCRNTSL